MKKKSGKGKRVAKRSVAHRVRTGIANVLLWVIVVILGTLCLAALIIVALRYYHTIFQH